MEDINKRKWHSDQCVSGLMKKHLSPLNNEEENYNSPETLTLTDLSYGPSMKHQFFTNVALQYGSSLIDSSKYILHNELDKYITVSKLKYFFSVDGDYVGKKLLVLLFPYANSDWTLKYVKNTRLLPKYDINAPDLYIPLMAFLTYIFIGGLFHGTKNMFSADILGVITSQALVWTTFEICLQLIVIYFISSANISYLELIAYAGYKFVSIVVCIFFKLTCINIILGLSIIYCGISSSYFIIKTLRSRIMCEDVITDLPQSSSIQNIEYKRKIYLLLMSGISHFFQIWWLSNF